MKFQRPNRAASPRTGHHKSAGTRRLRRLRRNVHAAETRARLPRPLHVANASTQRITRGATARRRTSTMSARLAQLLRISKARVEPKIGRMDRADRRACAMLVARPRRRRRSCKR
jgi:hypothetical protein